MLCNAHVTAPKTQKSLCNDVGSTFKFSASNTLCQIHNKQSVCQECFMNGCFKSKNQLLQLNTVFNAIEAWTGAVSPNS